MPFIRHEGRHILFVHIPKTGGTTIEKWLENYGELRMRTVGMPQALKITPQHFTFADIRTLLGENFFDYSFAIVRNPYDRLASEYKMQYMIGKKGMWNGFQTFPMWLENVSAQFNQQPWTLDNHLRPQWQFLTGTLRVFRYEDGLDFVVRKVAEETGLPHDKTPLPKLISSEGFDGKIIWDTKEIETVRQMYLRDFERFGYDINKIPETKA